MKKLLWTLIAVTLVAAVGFKVYQKVQQQALLQQAATTSRGRIGFNTPTVKTITAQPQPIRETLRLTGEIEADQEIAVQPRISGRVLALPVKEGEPVKANQLLAVLDDETIRIQVRQSEAALAGVKANLRQAEANLARARTEKGRYQELLDKKYISQADFENVTQSYLEAQSAVEVLQTQQHAAEQNLKLLQIQLGQTRVTAPLSGYVIKLPTTLGMNLTSGSTLLTIANLNPVKLKFTVDQRETAKIRKGAPVNFSCDIYPGREFTGLVREVAPTYDVNTRTLTLTAQLANPDHQLLPGLFGDVAIITGSKDAALVIPSEAAITREGRTGVFIVTANRIARFQPVTTGLQSEGQLEITTGLKPGDSVVVLGQNRLRDGQMVVLLRDGGPRRKHDQPGPDRKRKAGGRQ